MKNNFSIGLYSDIYRLIFFKLGMIIKTTKLYIFISNWMTFRHPLSHKFKYGSGWNSVCCHKLFIEAHSKFRELSWCDFIKYTYIMVIWKDTCEPACFKLGSTVWVSLMFSQGHRVTGKVELVQSFWCRVAYTKQLKCLWWLIMWGRWLWRSPVTLANMDCWSIICFSFFFLLYVLFADLDQVHFKY